MAIDETRARLLDAAGHEFALKGFEGATVRAICERAGVNLAAVNYHFGDKERLYEAVLLHAHRAGPILDASALADLEPREALGRFVGGFLARLLAQQETTWHQALMVREFASPTRASDTLIREAIRPHFQLLLSILRRLAPQLEERRLVAAGLSVVAQCLHYKMSRTLSEQIVGPIYRDLDHEFLGDHITRFSLAALGQGPPLTDAEPTGTDDPLHPPKTSEVSDELDRVADADR